MTIELSEEELKDVTSALVIITQFAVKKDDFKSAERFANLHYKLSGDEAMLKVADMMRMAVELSDLVNK